MNEILLIDKPAGWTSFDVVAKIRGKIRSEYLAKGQKPTKRQLRVGHAGTLDPFATGLLIILLGDACKDADTFLKLDKTYEFTAKLGEVSTTGDPEGVITPFVSADKLGASAMPTKEDILEVLQKFTGEITQTPPAFSAIKINGKRAYKLAREGTAVEIPKRNITIYSLELIKYDYPNLTCRIRVSSGTYIRTLVEDIGRTLNVGAYCKALRRTQIAEHSILDAKSIEEVL